MQYAAGKLSYVPLYFSRLTTFGLRLFVASCEVALSAKGSYFLVPSKYCLYLASIRIIFCSSGSMCFFFVNVSLNGVQAVL